MIPTLLTDKLWLKLKPILLDFKLYDKPNLRNIFTGILYQLKTGCPWRYLPSIYGKPNTIFKAYSRWSKSGLFLKLFKRLIQYPDMEWISIDGSHIRAHQSSSGAASSIPQSIAKSAGGNSSKIHMIVESHGHPLEFLISDGVTHDIKVAQDLISRIDLSETNVVNADKGYDSEDFREYISQRGPHPNIPRKRNSKQGNDHMDWYIYKSRHVVENVFARLNHFRGIATRFDKLKDNYASGAALACALIWLKL